MLLALAGLAAPLRAEDDTAALVATIKRVSDKGQGHREAAQATARLSQLPAAKLPELLVAMNDAVQRGDLSAGKAIWDQLGPIARYCWRPPIRDFRPRMKEVLRLQGHFPSSACREPQLGVSASERAEIEALCRRQGVIER